MVLHDPECQSCSDAKESSINNFWHAYCAFLLLDAILTEGLDRNF